jgi:D-alanyl-D-alanine carboxypeptidase
MLSWQRHFLHFMGFLAGMGGFLSACAVMAEPALVMDVASGDVLYEEQATDAWYPASLTKLMTIYVALSAVREGKIALDTPLVVSVRAASQMPSKMGFAPGTQVTLDNALKMLMVKSANDMAVTIAEGISGSVEAFAEDMNAAAASLGMRQSHFVNPNGLHDLAHVSSARDLAQIARALYLTFPEYARVYGIGSLRLGDEFIPTHNMLLGRYPGADGMKTGFTCASGFNLVASAERSGHRYIAVVLGAPSVAQREVKTAILLDRAFAGIDHPRGGLNGLFSQSTKAATAAPDLRNLVCKRRAFAMARFQAQLEALQAPLANQSSSFVADNALFPTAQNPAQQAGLMARKLMASVTAFEPVAVYVGAPAGYSGPLAQARPPHSPVGTEPAPVVAEANPPKPDVATPPTKGQEPSKVVRRGKAAAQTHAKSIAKAAHETRKVAHKIAKSTGKSTGDDDNAARAAKAKSAHNNSD